MSTPPLLAAKGLSIAFGNAAPVVQDVTFAIQPGRVLALVGESGSGKSLTSLAIPRLFAPGSGASIVAGSLQLTDGERSYDLVTASAVELRYVRRHLVGMVFQEPMASLNPVLPVGRQVAEAVPDTADPHDEVLRLFERVQLPTPRALLGRFPHELSGGQQQRVMIALALARRPRLLLADEPTTALDATVQHEVLDLLRHLQQTEGLSMLFVSHDLGVVARVADDIAVMQAGRIVEQGPREQILGAPQHPYTQGLLACRPRAGWRPHRLPTVSEVQTEPVGEPAGPAPHPTAEAPSSPAAPLLGVSHLTVTHAERGFRWPWQAPRPAFVAVRDVALQIAPGEKLGIVGESGCGKSTLARAIVGLQAYAGTIRFAGRVLPVQTPQRGIQMIFQDPMGSLNPRRTVRELLTEPMALHGIGYSATDREARAAELLRQVGLLPEHLNRRPAAFSGGQRQRICIARALGLNPSLLICDESVAALDVSVQAQVLNLLNDLRDALGLAILFISHDLNVVRYFTHRILVMQAGQIVETGESEALLANPQAAATQRLVAAIPHV